MSPMNQREHASIYDQASRRGGEGDPALAQGVLLPPSRAAHIRGFFSNNMFQIDGEP